MAKTILAIALCGGFAVLGWGFAREQGKAQTPSADEQAIRANVDAFVKAFNEHDAKSIGVLFHKEGKLITEDGEVIEGQVPITAKFVELFAADPLTKIEVTVDSIKFVGSDLALEVGSTKTTPAPGATPDVDRYTVVHIKRDGKWLMAFARDAEGDGPTTHQRLEPLGWMVGEWIDESPDAVVMTSCRWSPDKNFLLQDILVKSGGRDMMTINQRIGWDPVRKSIRSWVFDSEGGFGESFWTDAGDHWIIKATGVQPGGATASATNTITRTSNDSYHWHSADRVVGNHVQDPIDVRVVRKPPTAGNRKN